MCTQEPPNSYLILLCTQKYKNTTMIFWDLNELRTRRCVVYFCNFTLAKAETNGRCVVNFDEWGNLEGKNEIFEDSYGSCRRELNWDLFFYYMFSVFWIHQLQTASTETFFITFGHGSPPNASGATGTEHDSCPMQYCKEKKRARESTPQNVERGMERKVQSAHNLITKIQNSTQKTKLLIWKWKSLNRSLWHTCKKNRLYVGKQEKLVCIHLRHVNHNQRADMTNRINVIVHFLV